MRLSIVTGSQPSCQDKIIQNGSVWTGSLSFHLLGPSYSVPYFRYVTVSSDSPSISRPVIYLSGWENANKGMVCIFRSPSSVVGGNWYKGHSFRIGVAITAAACGLSEPTNHAGLWANGLVQHTSYTFELHLMSLQKLLQVFPCKLTFSKHAVFWLFNVWRPLWTFLMQLKFLSTLYL